MTTGGATTRGVAATGGIEGGETIVVGLGGFGGAAGIAGLGVAATGADGTEIAGFATCGTEGFVS